MSATNTPNPVRSSSTTYLLSKLDELLAKWQKQVTPTTNSGVKINSLLKEIARSRKQFDAKLFLVVIFGPLKAGKSTLTNTLANEYVSPTGFGKETTRRPSIIVRANQSCIQQFIQKDPTAPNSHKGFDDVTDYLRGLVSEEELSVSIGIKTFPFSPIHLEEKLVGEVSAEPLLTVIKVPGDDLLGSGTAIVDMPGLDGSKSNWTDDPIHQWVIDRADFFVFVQSSMAALNKETGSFLKEVVSKSKRPPMWIIQNKIDAKHWLPEADREAEAKSQKDEALARIREYINIPKQIALPTSSINLGQAWDGKQKQNPDWLEKSRFPEFQRNLTETLQSSRGIIQEKNSVNGLQICAKRTEESLRSTRNEVNERILSIDRQTKRFEAARAATNPQDIEHATSKLITRTIDDFSKQPEEAWKRNVNERRLKATASYNPSEKIAGEKLNSDFGTICHNLGVNDVNIHFGSLTQSNYSKLFEYVWSETVSIALPKLSEILKSLDIDIEKEIHLPAPLEKFPKIPETKLDFPPLANKTFFIFNETYSHEQRTQTLDHLESLWKKQIEERVSIWRTDLAGNLLKDIRTRLKHIEVELTHRQDLYITSHSTDREGCNHAIQICDSIISDPSSLDPLLAEASASIVS